MKQGDQIYYHDNQLGQIHGRVVADLGKTIQVCSPTGMHIIPREQVRQSFVFAVIDEFFGPLNKKS